MVKRSKDTALSENEARAKRIDWLRRKHAKAKSDYHFANGYRAGLECAVLAMEKGEDILGYSIDKGEATIR